MKRLVITIILCVGMIPVFSQKDIPDFSKIKTIPLESEGNKVLAEVYTSEKKIKTENDKSYTWVRANIVHSTQGSYDGRLLHGSYVEYYPDNQLLQKGKFENGLKTGEWKLWYPNGNLKEISNWKKGKQTGKFIQYNENGRQESKGNYRDGKMDGKIHFTDSNGKDTTLIYEQGNIKPAKEKKQIFKSGKKKKEIIPLTEEENKKEITNEDTKEKDKKDKKENKRKSKEKEKSEETEKEKKKE